VQGGAVAAGRGREPLVVGRDRTHLGHVQHRGDAVAEPLERPERGTTAARATSHSDCSSSPLLGVKSSRKCGRRVYHGPADPSCGVQDAGTTPRTMGSGGSAAFCFTHTCSKPAPAK
jgi:hypothetical protein